MHTITRVCAVVLAAVALCAASSTLVGAQPSFELGLKGGVGLANLSGSGLRSSDPFFEDLGGGFTAQGAISSGLGDIKPGFVGGAYVVARMNQQFGVRLEALYSSKGSKGDNRGVIGIFDISNTLIGTVDVGGTNTATLAYFEVPILAVMYFPGSSNGSFEIFAGPSLGFKTKAELKQEVTVSGGGQSQSESQTSDLSSSTADTDFGGVIGAGYSIRSGGAILSADLRWTQGFSNVDDSGGVDWKNHVIALSFGIGFPLGGGR